MESSVVVVCVLLVCSGGTGGSGQVPVVQVAQGQLRGWPADGYVSYLRVPYGTLNGTRTRFKAADAAPTWRGVSEVAGMAGEANSLVLDVHVPASPSGDPQPVLVWLPAGDRTPHPGALVSRGLIMVTVSIRVGVLGFLCLDNQKIPGNAGANDALTALRWVRDNIAAFGGDPARITAGGHGFGAALVEALTFSPASEGLFRAAIVQSGSAVSPAAHDRHAARRARSLAALVSDGGDDERIIKALVEADPRTLVRYSRELRHPYFPFGLCTERSQNVKDRFLAEDPLTTLEKGMFRQVPVMIGYNSDEGYIFASHLKRTRALGSLRADLAMLLPAELTFSSEREAARAADLVRTQYFGDNYTLQRLLEHHRDAYFASHVYRSVRARVAVRQRWVFMYQFCHASRRGVRPEPGLHKTGAAHSDELAYLFPEDGQLFDGDDGKVQQRLLTLWSDFVKHSDPTPEPRSDIRWETVSADVPRLLNIGLDIQMTELPLAHSVKLWERLYDKHYYKTTL